MMVVIGVVMCLDPQGTDSTPPCRYQEQQREEDDVEREQPLDPGILEPPEARPRHTGRRRMRVDVEDHQYPDDDGADRWDQHHGESTLRGVGSRGEPGEAEPDQADAPRDDRAVHEGFEVVASVFPPQEVREERTERGTDQRRPRRGRPAEDKEDRSHEKGDEHPINQDVLRIACKLHQSDGSTRTRP